MKDYFVHETAIVDEGATIGKGTKIWHFSQIMSELPGQGEIVTSGKTWSYPRR